MEILLLGLFGGFTYFIVKRSVAKITTTPVWLIWLVLMTPALIWTGWTMVYGQNTPIPTFLVIGPFILCPLLYFWLVQLGRIPPRESEMATPQDRGISPDLALQDLEPPSKKPPTRPITPEEEKSLRDCFPWGVFYLQNIDYRPQAILCRGKLRAIPEEAYKTVKGNVERVFSDRFLVLFQESFQGQPFFALVTNPWSKTPDSPPSERVSRPFFALFLLLLTLLTTAIVGMELNGVTEAQIEESLRLFANGFSLPALIANLALFAKGLPYSLGLIAILGCHETGHYLTAWRYKIRTTLPYFIPVPLFLGTFGAFIQMRSPTPHRKALFDVAIAGPLAGLIIAIPLLLWGLSLSEIIAIPEKSSLFSFDSLDPRFSFLLSVLAKIALGSQLVANRAIDLHPLAIAGYVGIIVTALNLMPVGQLDGGHIVHAMYGQKTAMLIGQFTRLLMFILALIRPDFLLWAILLLLMPGTDQPALNDVTELDNMRDFLGLFSLVLLLSILLPLPGAVAGWLGM
jgi:membrane-associated protease RseP (regulator of RpoE activity)